MIDFPLDQDHLLWLLDEMYYTETAAKTILEAHDPYFKNARTLMLDAIDPNKFIQKNPSTKEVTNSITFSRGNRPTEDGLLSETIFGITQEERASIYGYIDLDEDFINPYYYNIWLGLDRYLRPCVYETEKFILDDNGYLKPDPNGETGLKFLIKNKNKLRFKKTLRTDHLNALFHGRDNGTLFVNKLIIIPPYYRDVNTQKGGRVGIGEINKLYVYLINAVKGLRDTRLLGLDMLGASRGKIQDNLLHIHNWFTLGETPTGEVHSGAGIFKKFGIMRRAVMAKTTDYASRLVLSAPVINVESREDMICDTDHASVPLAAAVTISYPFMCFYLNRWFSNQFTPGGLFKYYNKKTKQEEMQRLGNTQVDFSNDRFDKELNEYIHGYSKRFKPIEITFENGDKVPLHFKGYNITEEEYRKGKFEDTTRLIERDFTWLDLFYICASEATKDRVAIITRYPIDSYFNHIYLKINISSTKKTMPMVIDGKFYKWYPCFKQEDIGKDTSNLFVDTLSFSNVFCKAAGADYDGDTASVKMLFSDEANAELLKYIDSKAQFINLEANNCRTPDKEAIQSMYNLTLILPDDMEKITKKVELE